MKAGYSAVCVMVRDEPDLREWVAYHLAVGFEHLYIYDNESKVPVSIVLRDFVAAGKVSTFLVTGKKRQVVTVFPDALRRAQKRFRWLAFIDADEFILPHDTDNVNEFLSGYENHAGVGINWQIFGDNGFLKRPDGLMIENYLRRGPDGFAENNQVKCIVSPTEAVWAQNPHSFSFFVEGGIVAPDGKSIPTNPIYAQAFNYPPVVSRIQINHYYIRSVEDFERKRTQGGGAGIQRNQGDFDNIKRLCNQVRDDRILRFAGRTKELMGTIPSKALTVQPSGDAKGCKVQVFRILPPPPFRSPKAISSHAGIDIRDLPSAQASGNTIRDREIAASLAHAGALRAFLDSEADFAIVLEDDAILAGNRDWMSFTNYDIFLPYCHNREHRPADESIRDGVLPQFGTFAYLCSRKFAVRYLPRLLAGEVADHALQKTADGLRKASFAGNLVNHDNDSVSWISEERRVFMGGQPTKAHQTAPKRIHEHINLGVITCHFNPAGFHTPQRNLMRFLRQCTGEGIPVFVAELAYDSDPWLLPDSPNVVRLRTSRNNAMWHKENLLNLVEKIVPPEINALAWIDADVWFERLDWFQAVEDALGSYGALQLFETVASCGRDGTLQRVRRGAGFAGFLDPSKTTPGFAWAARRSLWTEGGGLFERAVIGGGDRVNAGAWLPTYHTTDKWLNYGDLTHALAASRNWIGEHGGCSGVGGTIWHEWHGDVQNRQYEERHAILNALDITRDIVKREDGLLEFHPNVSDALRSDVLEYFRSRDEDGVKAIASKSTLAKIATVRRESDLESPWMEGSEIALLDRWLEGRDRVFEYGSGGSTVRWANGREWYFVEHDEKWFTKVTSVLARRNMAAHGVMIRPSAEVKVCFKGEYPAGYLEQWESYVHAPLQFGGEFDAVLVDGRARLACGQFAARKLLKPDGVILWHDFWKKDRERYHAILDECEVVEKVGSLAVLRRKPKSNAGL